MKQSLKAKWIRALRSGKFKQAHDYLYHKKAYCCLGVLCKVADISLRKARDGEQLSDTVRLKLGLTKRQQQSLIQLNDGTFYPKGEPRDFSFIADYIEKNL